jgi:3'-phosphoadenosine 5'-phosphosulfate sulfotransferase (PAPS reductase)/FAD synthetase
MSPLDRHEKAALCVSGGKDSLAVAYLLRDDADRITAYHNDTGDLLPEVMEIVEHVRGMYPRFVTVRTDVMQWIDAHGLPSDLIPHSQHPIGRMMAEASTVLVPRYDCCLANLMQPLFDRIVADGNTLLIRGTKAVDMNRLPVASGESPDGIEVWYPLQEWSNDAVFAYLRDVGAPICRVYEHVTNSPECARCSAWWGERRATYLQRYHPALYAEYRERMQAVLRELHKPLAQFADEVAALGGARTMLEVTNG